MNETVALDLPVNLHEGNPEPIEAAARLFQILNESGIRYCHWKSNLRLALGLQGRTDLDLLVDREQRRVFKKILYEQNIRQLLPADGQRFPAMEHYLACDDGTGKLIHLHVHYRLVLGEQFVKNFQLPLEDQFLNSAYLRDGVKVPAPEVEIIILSIRVLLKYRDRDALKDILSIRSSKIETDFMEEFEWLLAQTSIEAIAKVLEGISDIVPPALVLDFLDTLNLNPRAGFKLLQLRHQARRMLRLYRRSPPLQATLEYFREMLERHPVVASLSPTTKMTLPEGGLRLAIIGIDGAGKSTQCRLLYKWLSWKLDVHICYLGSKPPSRRAKLLYWVFRFFRRGQRTVSGLLGETNLVWRWLSDLRDLALAWHYLATGQDRYRRYRAGEKRALGGSLVIYDRFPLGTIDPQIDATLMDGAQIASLAANKRGGLLHSLSRKEAAIYQHMRPPDHLIVLNVSPELSLQRKPDHVIEALETKLKAIRKLTAGATSKSPKPVIYVNANAPLEEVTARLKKEVWNLL